MKTKKSIKKYLLIAIPCVLVIWHVILMFLEKDHLGAIQTWATVFGFIVAIITAISTYKEKFKRLAFIIYIVIVIILLIVDIKWTIGVIHDKNINITNTQTSNDENGSSKNDDTIVETAEVRRNVINFNFANDHFIISLDEYTLVQGNDEEKIHSLLDEKMEEWMAEWNSKALGEAGDGYNAKRGKIDELYNICCKPEAESKYLQEKAIKDYEELINEIDCAYDIWHNPELKKEKALMYLDMGDLYQSLGENSKARDCFEKAMDVSWEGIEASIQYGMGTNVEKLLEVLGDCFEKIETLPDANLSAWEHSRANLLKQVFNEMSKSIRKDFIDN